MNAQTTQIKLTLPVSLKGYLQTKADKYGLPITAYLKHMIIKEVEDVDYPTYEMSERTEKKLKKAMKDYKAGKAIEVRNLKKYFDEL